MYRWLLAAFLMFALNSAIAAQNILITQSTVITESDDDCDDSCPLPEDGDENVASGCPGGGDDDGDGDEGGCPHQSTAAEGCPGGGDDDGDGDGGGCPHQSTIAHGCGDDGCDGDDNSGDDKN
ncbi:MAG: hypothetical protein VX619_07950 [bacterium]|nr:hypothetical protein [bacterium]